MKIEALIKKMKDHAVTLPTKGSGRNGKILAKDLEKVIGDHFLRTKYTDDKIKVQHCQMRRNMKPMKAFSYSKLRLHEQTEILRDNSAWYAEEKYNGWRMIVTFIPGDGFCFWGGNLSDVDCLPVDYTEHILLGKGFHPRSEAFRHVYDFSSVAFDTEALTEDDIETLDGAVTDNTLDAVGALLGSDPERAITLQKEGVTLSFKVFDAAPFFNEKPDFKLCAKNRNLIIEAFMVRAQEVKNFAIAPKYWVAKEQTLNAMWKQGKEGLVFKHKEVNYVPGGRLRTHAVKVKRTMSGEIGDNIDAFISGYILTEQYSKKDLIGGIKLSVVSINEENESKVHHIATVTGMPDAMREELTSVYKGVPLLDSTYEGLVLEIDGQELSRRNAKLMHARVNWQRGFRKDKSWNDCILDLAIVEETQF